MSTLFPISGIRLVICLIFVFIVSGCATDRRTEIPEAVRVGVYAEYDAMKAGRYDVAQSVGTDLLRIVPAPKKRVIIKIATQASVPVTVLPPAAAPKTIQVGTPSFKLTFDSGQNVDDIISNFSHSVDQQQIKQTKDAAKDRSQVDKDKIVIASTAKYKMFFGTVVGGISLVIVGYLAIKFGFL